VLKKLRITSIAVATLLASPAFAGWSLAQPAQPEPIDDQRTIREVVVNGRLIEGVSDDSAANELRPVPSWVDRDNSIDSQPQRSW